MFGRGALMEQGQAGKLETAILAGGCFWSLEAVFDRLQGVDRAESDYMGGDVGDPSYEQDCNRDTGYAEIVRITFDPNIVSDRELPEVFFLFTIGPRSTARVTTWAVSTDRPFFTWRRNSSRKPSRPRRKRSRPL